MRKNVVCSVTSVRNGRTAHGLYEAPTGVHAAAQLNYMLLSLDNAGKQFAKAAEAKHAAKAYRDAARLYSEVNQ